MYYKKMKEIRTKKGITQKQIAEKMGIDQRQYSRYEQGKNEFPIRYLIQFCYICNVHADEVLEINL